MFGFLKKAAEFLRGLAQKIRTWVSDHPAITTIIAVPIAAGITLATGIWWAGLAFLGAGIFFTSRTWMGAATKLSAHYVELMFAVTLLAMYGVVTAPAGIPLYTLIALPIGYVACQLAYNTLS